MAKPAKADQPSNLKVRYFHVRKVEVESRKDDFVLEEEETCDDDF